MSDTGRQSFTDKAGAALKPDSEKTTGEHVGDAIKGAGDSLASTIQPQNDKSSSQKIGDTLSSNQNEDQRTLTEKAKDTLGLGNK
ncbi:heat shock protein 9/12-domain-containing protein [Cantharellus anzutake]|uniref:heat shock protein 9/12-domain-containing protein n=1 Tax=Cantharellus anzutake TaxID=1750568 RepID=UPI0019052018|nr:heat shock protein 9/12-domain-containing protein [Cantharellus anzutake]KAF8342328.1 heat shock protein 9/12-domain-containing protein [Cantharellus anzutake]